MTQACKRLCLAQSTVSGQVIQFEKFLGKKLFVRQGKSQNLTAHGKIVMSYANRIFGQSKEMLEVLEKPDAAGASIRIGVAEDVSKQAALLLLESAIKDKKRINVQLDEGTLQPLLERLNRHSLDLVLSDQGGVAGQNSDLIRTEVARVDVVFAAVPKMARQVTSYPRGLSKIPLIIPSEISNQWGVIQHFLLSHNISSPVTIELSDAGLMRQAALRGMGAAPLSRIAIAEDLKRGTLVQLGKAPTGITRTLWLTARRGYSPQSVVGQMMSSFRIR